MIYNLIPSSFLDEIEKDLIAAVGISLVKNGKVVSARTVRSLRAERHANGEILTLEVLGGEGLPFIVTDKPANTKLPLDYVGTKIGRSGKQVKVFELKPKLKDWKAIKNIDTPDFVLARAIAKNPRKATDIGTEAIKYVEAKVLPKITRQLGKAALTNIVNVFE